ncbi:TPA: hypothetical protein ROY30_002144 [Bacillus cereus]|nr:hypothetical protein [Bacillus cereus]
MQKTKPTPKPKDEVHKNSHSTKAPAIGYSLRDKKTHAVLKYGETTQGTARYTQKFYKQHNAYMLFEAKGTKKEMHEWQHKKTLAYKKKHNEKRPPLNKSDY